MAGLSNVFKSMFGKTSYTGKLKMVIVVRTDLLMGKGKIGAQCAHAAVECYKMTLNSRNHEMAKSWIQLGQPKIVLQISCESDLLNLARQAKRAGLTAAAIRDAGRTQVSQGTLTVLGIGPGPTDAIDELTSKMRLL